MTKFVSKFHSTTYYMVKDIEEDQNKMYYQSKPKSTQKLPMWKLGQWRLVVRERIMVRDGKAKKRNMRDHFFEFKGSQ